MSQAVISAKAEPHERSHEEIMFVLIALMLAMFLGALDQTIVATALPKIATDLHGLNKLSWVATAYLLTAAISTPLYGKIGDQFGRKKIFQSSIVLFLIGSALCGLSHSMDQLVGFRALQGIGAGGLTSLSMAIVGDVVPPRQRGKYLSYFAGVFALTSVIGPLLGGFFTDDLSWRWVFYVNLPIGILALAAIETRLHLPATRTKTKVDYLGAGLLTACTVPILLATTWGGVTYAWTSATIIALMSVSVIMGVLLVLWEQRQATAVAMVPTHLFKNDIFSVSVILSILSGAALFAAILFIPEYQQIVRGYSATKSGLYLIPMMVGMLVSMIMSGRFTTKTGHYRILPIIGTIVTGIGIWLFSHLSLTTSQFTLSIWMLVIGLGIGSFMQVMTLAVQNTVKRRDLGVATGTIAFSRNIGSSIGAAVFGTILTNRLTVHLKALLPNLGGHSSNITGNVMSGTSSAALSKMPPNVSHAILSAFVLSFRDLFLLALPIVGAALITALFLREAPLKTTIVEEI